MTKRLIKFLIYLIIILILAIAYLSVFGISTTKFNKKIKAEILNINKKVNLELKTVNLLLDPLNFSINIKTLAPAIIVENNQIKLESVKTNISLKSLIKNQFTIDDLKISTKAIKLNDLILLVRSFKNTTQLLILDQIIKDGFLIADINLNFDNKGRIKNDYKIDGFIKNAKINIFNKYNINSLNFLFEIKKDDYFLKEIDSKLNQFKIFSPKIKIKKINNKYKVDGIIKNSNKDIDIDFLDKLLNFNIKDFNIKKINFSSENNFSLEINNKFKVEDFNLKSLINLNSLKYENNSSLIKDYIPSYKNSFKLEDHKISINYNKKILNINGKGKIKIEDSSDDLDYKITKNKNNYTFDTNLRFKKNPLLLKFLQYEKKENNDSLLNLTGIFHEDKKIEFNQIIFKENNNSFFIKSLKLDNKLKIKDINSLKINYKNKNKIESQIELKKTGKNFKISGKSFDLTNLINKIFDNDTSKSSSIFKNLNSKVLIEIKKSFLDNTTFVNNLNGFIDFKNNEIDKLSLESTFSNKKKLTLTVNTNINKEKITTFYSSYPKPIIKRYKFIKGFEEGALDFYSIKKNNVTNSVLKIDDFKIQEVPVLAKLLTLASLQGIADLLTGEGIRFTDFEMKFSSNQKLITIQELYAIGPAISIMMDGYIESEKLISLRGTLVPATTINKTIASIPLLGDILVGKKTGEGIFGVSFKIKGPPKDLKTTVNPIKTLTPRFITRTLEKIKK